MEHTEKKSLIDELQLQNDYEVVIQERGKIVYKHTMYYEFEDIDYEKYITETEEPVDNLFSEKQQRLSIDTLQNDQVNWTERNFMTASNVGIYYDKNIVKPVVPDMFLSFDVKQPDNWFEKKNKAYFTWVVGKNPELVLEIISNKVGDEDGKKLQIYEKMRVKYYIIQDPYEYLSHEKLRLYILDEKQGKYEKYIPKDAHDFYFMPEVNLGMVLWKGLYEDTEAQWKRWCNKEGTMLRTGKEAIAQEKEEKIKAKERAEKEKKDKERAEKEKEEAEAREAQTKVENKMLLEKMKALEEKLAKLGVTPID